MTIRSSENGPRSPKTISAPAPSFTKEHYLSDALQTAVLKSVLSKLALTGTDQQLPATVHVQHGVNRLGKRLHYYFNYSGDEVRVSYAYRPGTNLLDGKPVSTSSDLALSPWDLAIIEEN